MTGSELIRYTEIYKTLFCIERIFPQQYRRYALRVCGGAVIVALFLSIRAGTIMSHDVAYGLFFITAGLWMIVLMIELYVRSISYTGIPDEYAQTKQRHAEQILSYELADIILSAPVEDIVWGLYKSKLGTERALRLGIMYTDMQSFFLHRTRPVAVSSFAYEGDMSERTFFTALIEIDTEFKDYVAGYGITQELFVETLLWVSDVEKKRIQQSMWWTRGSLGRIPSIARDWAMGMAPTLARFAEEIQDIPEYRDISEDDPLYQKASQELEGVLVRSRNANALVVADMHEGRTGPVVVLAKKIARGHAYPELEHKRVYMLYADRIFTEARDLQTLEGVLHKFFTEVAKAEEVVLVISDMAGLITSARTYSLDIVELMRPYISSPVIQVIGLVDMRTFEEDFRMNNAIGELFEHIIPEPVPAASLISYVRTRALSVEKREGVVFTYKALTVLADNVVRLFVPKEYIVRTESLIDELATHARGEGKMLITKSHVEDILSIKTGVPGSSVSPAEKAKLLELETYLHTRVIGQDTAIRGIADALRRARSGIGNPLRPLGSFLFLGPTGVGKTETARSLAAVFFDTEQNMIRFDMTEYSGADALSRFIGDATTGKPGTLVSRLREKPYGILLLDEFEKANSEVHDLFLQILDEGKFSDMHGEEVNARNVIIIATSNAGSELIWNMVQAGHDAHRMRETVIDTIVTEGIFKPELLNRFDGVIAFHPLKEEHLQKVAEAMLQKLVARLKDQGYALSYSPDLVAKLVQIGSDPKFGARPIARAIAERVEGVIAKRILEGTLKTGDTLMLSGKDLL